MESRTETCTPKDIYKVEYLYSVCSSVRPFRQAVVSLFCTDKCRILGFVVQARKVDGETITMLSPLVYIPCMDLNN